MDAKDLLRRWKEIAKTCGLELNIALPRDKAKWIKACDAAQNVVNALAPVVSLEKSALRQWQEARREPSDKPRPVLKLVQ